MLLPIRTNVSYNKTPYTNYALIAINVFIFILSYYPHTKMVGYRQVQVVLREWVLQFQLNPAEPEIWQFVTYAFLHGGVMHIFGNMFFLFIFGNNVNDKLGHLGYLCFYLAGAVFSGFGHSLLHSDPIPLVGASGAVAAVTGAYLVLFPQTLITVVYWFFFIGTIDIPAIYFIGFKLIFWDNVYGRGPTNIAYDAHLAGYAFGIGLILIMLATGILSRSTFDLWSMLKRWNQRRQYRGMVDKGFDPFSGRRSKVIKVKQRKVSEAELKRQEEVDELRSKISENIDAGNMAGAAEAYITLMHADSEQVISKQQLLDISNQLMSMGKYEESARAYEKFMAHYSGYEYSEQVELMLGVLYSRYLDDKEKALKYLEGASDKLRDQGQKKMCEDEIDKLKD